MTRHIFDRICSLSEASERSGLSTARLRQLIDEGRLPAKKVGATWLVLAEDVDSLRGASWRGRPGRPIAPLAGNWVLGERAYDEQERILYDATAVLAEPMESSPGFRLIFVDIRGRDPLGYELTTDRDPVEFWRWITLAVDDWAGHVERARGYRVDREWPATPPDGRIELAAVDPDWPPDLTGESLRMAAPVDIEEARRLLADERSRLTNWVLGALAARIAGRVWRRLDQGDLLDGVIEIRGRTDPSLRERVGVYVFERASEVTLESNFKPALRRHACDSGYVVTVDRPSPGELELARHVRGVRFEAMDDLIRSVRG